MTRQEAIKLLKPFRNCMVDQYGCPISDVVFALDIAIEALQGDMYCPSCGVRLVPENEYVEPKPYKAESEE